MLEEPSLDLPFTDEGQRGLALAQLLTACVELERWQARARNPAVMSPEERQALARSVEAGDTAELKLSRWASLFNDELYAVFESRNRVAHGIRLGDKELRGAVWLAQRLLRLIDPVHA